jgi:hypothetical protein
LSITADVSQEDSSAPVLPRRYKQRLSRPGAAAQVHTQRIRATFVNRSVLSRCASHLRQCCAAFKVARQPHRDTCRCGLSSSRLAKRGANAAGRLAANHLRGANARCARMHPHTTAGMALLTNVSAQIAAESSLRLARMHTDTLNECTHWPPVSASCTFHSPKHFAWPVARWRCVVVISVLVPVRHLTEHSAGAASRQRKPVAFAAASKGREPI